MDLAQKLYQSVVETLKELNQSAPSWEEMPQAFRDKFEAEINEGLRKLANK